ncbi:hypothetical protein OsI_23395 [Oryza sativa Indica Group]|uniref:Uncharacterized protein n=1 Tax=Oryza sativa subsp. indica TaxID=39946 RepID=A2YE50_ORYSI|nr:hypothetical protein OsI_23395 [Oryza sativa Indica Group]
MGDGTTATARRRRRRRRRNCSPRARKLFEEMRPRDGRWAPVAILLKPAVLRVVDCATWRNNA